MTNQVKVAISSDFLTAFARLPRGIQGKVTEFLGKFRNNPMSPGIHYEKLGNGIDKKILHRLTSFSVKKRIDLQNSRRFAVNTFSRPFCPPHRYRTE